MSYICPAILASDEEAYKAAIAKVSGFAHRLQIDLTDGKFAASTTIQPDQVWWPAGVKADIHLMFEEPLAAAKVVAEHQPSLVIIHAESIGRFNDFVALCHSKYIKVGVALLAQTLPEQIAPQLDSIDHVLIFSGDLGKYGGNADLSLLDKVKKLKTLKPSLEVGWDGGVNSQNISQLAFGGVDVFDVGGFILGSDNPEQAYKTLERIASETGTT